MNRRPTLFQNFLFNKEISNKQALTIMDFNVSAYFTFVTWHCQIIETSSFEIIDLFLVRPAAVLRCFLMENIPNCQIFIEFYWMQI